MSLMDLSFVIEAFSAPLETTWRRYARSVGVRGRQAPMAFVFSQDIVVNAQPVSNAYKKQSSGFTAGDDVITVWSRDAFKLGDWLEIADLGVYEAQNSMNWDANGGYFKTYCRKFQDEELTQFLDVSVQDVVSGAVSGAVAS